jgi:hypothetical protein
MFCSYVESLWVDTSCIITTCMCCNLLNSFGRCLVLFPISDGSFPDRKCVEAPHMSMQQLFCRHVIDDMGSQKSNLTGVFSPSPSKKQCTSRGEKKVDLIGPAYIRMHLLGFAFDLDALQFGFINPGSIESVRKGVRQTMEHVSTVRNAAREKEKMVLLKFTHRPGPNPKVAGSKDKCPFGFSAGALALAIGRCSQHDRSCCMP